MRILILNGSPRSEKSNTMHLTRAFVEGLAKDGDVVDTIDIAKSDIQGCRGCMACWATGGVCAIKDDVPRLQEELYFKADLVIWSFPLYFFSLPSKMKAFMDRLFLNDCPDMVMNENGFPTHPSRHDTSGMRDFVISTCGFYTSEGLYDAVRAQFNIVFKDQFAGMITCGQGGLFESEAAAPLTRPYLEKVKAAGREFSASGALSDKTQAGLTEPIISKEKYMDMANKVERWKHKYNYSNSND